MRVPLKRGILIILAGSIRLSVIIALADSFHLSLRLPLLLDHIEFIRYTVPQRYGLFDSRLVHHLGMPELTSWKDDGEKIDHPIL